MAAWLTIKEGAHWVIAVLLAGLFFYAGVVKAWEPDLFLTNVIHYRILNPELSWGVALVLPYLEMVTALALLVPNWRKSAAWVLLTLIGLFLLVSLSAWGRGLELSCGCFGEAFRMEGFFQILIRNLLILVALWVLIRGKALPHLH